jgi:hypothetical protein
MFNSNSSAIPQKGIKDLQIIETMLLLFGSVILQFVIHLMPSPSLEPLGKVLLPMFFAPLIAVIFFRLHVGLIAGIFAPVVNYLITGLPKPELLILVTVELAIFTLICYLLIQYRSIKNINALIAIIAAKLFSASIIYLILGSNHLNTFFQSLLIAVPGILILFVLNILLLRYKERM